MYNQLLDTTGHVLDTNQSISANLYHLLKPYINERVKRSSI